MEDTLRSTIITSETANRMLDRVSPIYDNGYVALWMFEAIGKAYDELWNIEKTLPEQLFPETVTWAIDLWEKRYGITPALSQTLEERRDAILAARGVPASFIPFLLEKYIYNLALRTSEVVDYVRDFTFGVYIENTEGMRSSDLVTIMDYISRHKPSHLSYELAFQSSACISIKIETGYWHFPYHMAGTSNAGTLPQANIIFDKGDGAVLVDAYANPFTIPYDLAGTKPDTNIIAQLIDGNIEANEDGANYLFHYMQSGSKESGTVPNITSLGVIQDSTFSVVSQGTGYSISHESTGTKPEYVNSSNLQDAGICTLTDEQGYKISYVPCGSNRTGMDF